MRLVNFFFLEAFIKVIFFLGKDLNIVIDVIIVRILVLLELVLSDLLLPEFKTFLVLMPSKKRIEFTGGFNHFFVLLLNLSRQHLFVKGLPFLPLF